MVQSCVVAALVSAALLRAEGGAIRYVDDDAPPGGDGLTWESAYRFLQDALTHAAASGGAITEIRIAQGLYKPDQDEAGNVTPGDREATFQLIDGFTLMGGFAGIPAPDPDERNVQLYETILSGDLLNNDQPGYVNTADNSLHVVTSILAGGSTTIDGLTVTGGNANGAFPASQGGGLYGQGGNLAAVACTFSANQANQFGGAVYVQNCAVTFTNCHIMTNAAVFDQGGGVYLEQSIGQFFGCNLSGNTADTTHTHDEGGALYVPSGSTAHLDGCVVNENSAAGGGAIYAAGALTMLNCTLVANVAASFDGGAIEAAANTTLALSDCQFSQNQADRYGGAIRSSLATLDLTSCEFDANSAEKGGALFDVSSTMTLSGCTFLQNSVPTGGGFGAAIHLANLSNAALTDCLFEANAGNRGGGIFCTNGTVITLECCVFQDNFAALSGGAIEWTGAHPGAAMTCEDSTFVGNESFNSGGAIVANFIDVMLRGCLFANNAAAGGAGLVVFLCAGTMVDCAVVGNTIDGGSVNGGAGMVLWMSDEFSIVNCSFMGNAATGFPVLGGGGLSIQDSSTQITQCLFSGNSFVSTHALAKGGGGVHALNSEASFLHCTFSGNSTTIDGGGVHSESSDVTLTNCILWGNSDSNGAQEASQVFHDAASSVVVNYSCVQGLTGALGGIGNIGADPQFVDAEGADGEAGTQDDDLRLGSISPCIDAGDNTAVPQDIPTDLDGNPRFLEIPETPDTGNGELPIVDMGPYEALGGGCLAVTSQEVVCHADGATFTVIVEGLSACTGGTSMTTFTGSGGVIGEEMCFTLLVNDGGFCCSTEICVTVPNCSQPSEPCDLDADGVVGVADFIALLSAWGACPDCGNCLADFDGDCSVGITDLLVLLANWT